MCALGLCIHSPPSPSISERLSAFLLSNYLSPRREIRSSSWLYEVDSYLSLSPICQALTISMVMQSQPGLLPMSANMFLILAVFLLPPLASADSCKFILSHINKKVS